MDQEGHNMNFYSDDLLLRAAHELIIHFHRFYFPLTSRSVSSLLPFP
jgi:hypothetical protein